MSFPLSDSTQLRCATIATFTVRLTSVALTTIAALAWTPALAQETFKLGIVTFLSGPAAESFGVPAANGGKVLIEALNAGTVPAPYNKKGFGGMQIVPVIVDENGGATKQVQEMRNLFDREKVDAVIGYVGSGDCLAVAPVAEEMKRFLVLYDCGTPRIFEEKKYNYVFRTASHAAMDNIGLVRYMKKKGITPKDVVGINQDYAWGQDSWRDFKASLEAMAPTRACAAPGASATALASNSKDHSWGVGVMQCLLSGFCAPEWWSELACRRRCTPDRANAGNSLRPRSRRWQWPN